MIYGSLHSRLSPNNLLPSDGVNPNSQPVLIVTAGELSGQSIIQLDQFAATLSVQAYGPFGFILLNELQPMDGVAVDSQTSTSADTFSFAIRSWSSTRIPAITAVAAPTELMESKGLSRRITTLLKQLRPADENGTLRPSRRPTVAAYVIIDLQTPELGLTAAELLVDQEAPLDITAILLSGRTQHTDDDHWRHGLQTIYERNSKRSLFHRVYLIDGCNTAQQWMHHPAEQSKAAAQFILLHAASSFRGLLRQYEQSRTRAKQPQATVFGSSVVRSLRSDMDQVQERVAGNVAELLCSPLSIPLDLQYGESFNTQETQQWKSRDSAHSLSPGGLARSFCNRMEERFTAHTAAGESSSRKVVGLDPLWNSVSEALQNTLHQLWELTEVPNSTTASPNWSVPGSFIPFLRVLRSMLDPLLTERRLKERRESRNRVAEHLREYNRLLRDIHRIPLEPCRWGSVPVSRQTGSIPRKAMTLDAQDHVAEVQVENHPITFSQRVSKTFLGVVGGLFGLATIGAATLLSIQSMEDWTCFFMTLALFSAALWARPPKLQTIGIGKSFAYQRSLSSQELMLCFGSFALSAIMLFMLCSPERPASALGTGAVVLCCLGCIFLSRLKTPEKSRQFPDMFDPPREWAKWLPASGGILLSLAIALAWINFEFQTPNSLESRIIAVVAWLGLAGAVGWLTFPHIREGRVTPPPPPPPPPLRAPVVDPLEATGSTLPLHMEILEALLQWCDRLNQRPSFQPDVSVVTWPEPEADELILSAVRPDWASILAERSVANALRREVPGEHWAKALVEEFRNPGDKRISLFQVLGDHITREWLRDTDWPSLIAQLEPSAGWLERYFKQRIQPWWPLSRRSQTLDRLVIAVTPQLHDLIGTAATEDDNCQMVAVPWPQPGLVIGIRLVQGIPESELTRLLPPFKAWRSYNNLFRSMTRPLKKPRRIATEQTFRLLRKKPPYSLDVVTN